MKHSSGKKKNQGRNASQLRHGPCGRRRGIFGRLVHRPHILGPGLAEYRCDGGKTAGEERPVTNPVVITMAVDCSDMVREVDIATGSDHGDEREEDGVWSGGRKKHIR